MFKVYVERKKSKNGDNTYLMMYVNLGYRNLTLSYDNAIISELSNITIRDLNNLPVDEPKLIGSIKID